jgi:hypothetical protein
LALQTPWGVGEWIDVADCRWVWLVVIDDAVLSFASCDGFLVVDFLAVVVP